MKYFPSNTLAHYLAAPQMERIDLSGVSSETVAKALIEYRKDIKEVSPDHDAMSFYGMNHVMSELRKEFTPNQPLPADVMYMAQQYTRNMASQAQRMFHYMILICTREARHIKQSTSGSEAMWSSLGAQVGKNGTEWVKGMHKYHPDELEAAKRFQSDPPPMSCAQYMFALKFIFNNGVWGGGYGGEPWGKVADCVYQFLIGNISQEMMLDTAYTLAHNNGPIFNKGMLYKHYLGPTLYTILDVQRSGQIPELIADPTNYGDLMQIKPSEELKGYMAMFRTRYPNKFAHRVDWDKVVQMGSLHTNASTMKAMQGHQKSSSKGTAWNIGPTWNIAPPSPMPVTVNGKQMNTAKTFVVVPGTVLTTLVRSK